MLIELDRRQAPEAKKIMDFKLLDAQTIQLPNGIPFTYFSGGAQPILHFQLVFAAGKWHETLKGQSVFMGKMMGEGTTNMTSEQISEHFDRYGAFWQASSGTDWTTIECYCMGKHLGLILPVLHDLLQNAIFPKEEWETNRDIALQQLKVSQEKTSYIASVTFKEKLFGENHPYGSHNTIESIQSLGVPALQDFYQHHIQHGQPMLFLAGQVEDQHIQLVNDTFSSWKGKEAIFSLAEHPISTSVGEVYQEKTEAMQSSIRIGKPLFKRNHPHQLPFQVLNTIFGGYFGSRLMQNIREDKGLSYGIYSNSSYMKEAGFFFISADVEKSNRELAVAEIYHEMAKLREVLVDEAELNRVKNYICGSLVKSIDSPLTVVNCHKAVKLYDLHQQYYDLYMKQIWRVSAQEIRDLANRYFTGDWVQVVAG